MGNLSQGKGKINRKEIILAAEIDLTNKEVAQVAIKNRHSITIARKVKVKAEVLEVVIKTKKEEALEKK
jgi:hypothetical protein